jgi:hypothetical protein
MDPGRRADPQQRWARLGVWLCAVGFGFACAGLAGPRPLVEPPADARSRSYRELFASVPDLTAALAPLRWNGGDEAEAARLMSVLVALWQAYSDQVSARELTDQLVHDAWSAHPELVSASVCTYCGVISHAIEEQVKTQPIDREWAERIAPRDPVWLARLAQRDAVPRERVLSASPLLAELFVPGDAPTAEFVADALIEQQLYAPLIPWVGSGLNGGRALGGVSDVSSLPLSVVVASWEQGVRIADHSARLTEYLVRQGHRPALRWAVWVIDQSAPYIGRSYVEWNHKPTTYLDAVMRHAPFLLRPNQPIARVYSDRWRDIAWDAAERRWRLRERS